MNISKALRQKLSRGEYNINVCYYSYVIDKTSEAQGGKATCLNPTTSTHARQASDPLCLTTMFVINHYQNNVSKGKLTPGPSRFSTSGRGG